MGVRYCRVGIRYFRGIIRYCRGYWKYCRGKIGNGTGVSSISEPDPNLKNRQWSVAVVFYSESGNRNKKHTQGDQTALYFKGPLYTGHLSCITLYLPFICLKALYFWEKMVNNESFSLIYFGISWTSKRMELVPLLYLPMPPLFMILIYIDEYLLKLVQKSTLGIVFIYPHVIVQSNLWIT